MDTIDQLFYFNLVFMVPIIHCLLLTEIHQFTRWHNSLDQLFYLLHLVDTFSWISRFIYSIWLAQFPGSAVLSTVFHLVGTVPWISCFIYSIRLMHFPGLTVFLNCSYWLTHLSTSALFLNCSYWLTHLSTSAVFLKLLLLVDSNPRIS